MLKHYHYHCNINCLQVIFLICGVVTLLVQVGEAFPVHIRTGEDGHEEYFDSTVDQWTSCTHLCQDDAKEDHCKINCPHTWKTNFGLLQNRVKLTCAENCTIDEEFCDDMFGICRLCMEFCEKVRKLEGACRHHCPGEGTYNKLRKSPVSRNAMAPPDLNQMCGKHG